MFFQFRDNPYTFYEYKGYLLSYMPSVLKNTTTLLATLYIAEEYWIIVHQTFIRVKQSGNLVKSNFPDLNTLLKNMIYYLFR